jgi:hypothetical protein
MFGPDRIRDESSIVEAPPYTVDVLDLLILAREDPIHPRPQLPDDQDHPDENKADDHSDVPATRVQSYEQTDSRGQR